jgi:hypothetical protein
MAKTLKRAATSILTGTTLLFSANILPVSTSHAADKPFMDQVRRDFQNIDRRIDGANARAAAADKRISAADKRADEANKRGAEADKAG